MELSSGQTKTLEGGQTGVYLALQSVDDDSVGVGRDVQLLETQAGRSPCGTLHEKNQPRKYATTNICGQERSLTHRSSDGVHALQRKATIIRSKT